MEGSTGNYSGASSSGHPPSLYDTSVSSASAGKSSWRNATPAHSSYSEREDLQYALANQYPNEYRNTDRGNHMYSKYPRSMDGSDYKQNRDIAAMSDPGVSRYDQYYGQRRSPVEYAHSEIASPSSSYSESQYRFRKSSRPLREEMRKETKPRYSQNRISSASVGRKSLSPPPGQAHSVYFRDAGRTSRDNSFLRGNEGYRDDVHATSPMYNDLSHDSSLSKSAGSVKELQRQLWNNNDTLRVRSSSPPQYYRIQQSLSPVRNPRRPGPSNNLSRFARSLSPRRRQYHHSSPMNDESPLSIQKAGSTASEASYNSRFHSKFVEAALVAQKRPVVGNEGEGSPKRVQQYREQQERRRQFSSSRQINEVESDRLHQNLRGNEYVPSSSLMRNASNRNGKIETYKEPAEYPRRNDGGINTRISKVGYNSSKVDYNSTRPPIIPPSPSSSFSPTETNYERQERHQPIPVDRGRSNDSPQFRKNDGRSGRRLRPPSPLLLDRIRSFDGDYDRGPAHGVSQGQEQAFTSLERSQDNANENVNDRMANLVDKLSAVNRENPTSALAQIDSILRDENRSSHGQTFESHHNVGHMRDEKVQKHDNYAEPTFHEKGHDDNADEEINSEDDDESSDVSSITNPTFQPGRHSSKQMDSLYIQENDHYAMHNSAENSNTLTYNPSTSSFRRPRPSHLQNYSKDASKDSNGMSRSEWKRQQLKMHPPPSTIKVKDDPVKSGSHRRNSSDVREKMLQKNMKIEASRGTQNEKLLDRKEKAMIAPSKPKKRLDNKLMADKQELAKKNRSWDEISNRLSKTRSEPKEHAKVYQEPGALSKQHPWDRNVNFVQTKDTSMDDAIGIEAELSTSGRNYDSYNHRNDIDAEISIEGSGISSEMQGRHFEKARRNIKGRSDRKRFHDQPKESSEKGPSASEKARRNSRGRSDRNRFHDQPKESIEKGPSASDDSASDQMPSIETPMTGIPQFNPSEQRMSSRSEKKSDSEGSSWVAMPPSSYFPDVNDDIEPINSKNSLESKGVSESLDMRGISAGVNKLKIQDEDGASEFRSITRLACKTNANKGPKLKEKKRGFLKAFMEKKKAKAPNAGYAASAAERSVSGHSNSVESRGVKSASHLQSKSTPNSPSIPGLNFHILPPPPGVLNVDYDGRSRAGYRSTSAPRQRSKSSEKFRSTSMAKKFNRVMQLYDSDET